MKTAEYLRFFITGLKKRAGDFQFRLYFGLGATLAPEPDMRSEASRMEDRDVVEPAAAGMEVI